ncbi:MAG: hypothetical protein ACFFA3_05775 [Promethearchaeota archaeon]
MESEKTEIIDFSGEKFHNFTMPCWIVMILVPVLAILDTYLMIRFPESPLAILLSLSLIGIFIIYYYYVATKSPGKLRKVSISYDEIVFELPHRPQYTIFWSECEKIEIKLKKLGLKPFDVYHFRFINDKADKKIILSLNDFHKSKITDILKIIKEHAYIMNKEFSAIKESEVSGVHFIEDLEIN